MELDILTQFGFGGAVFAVMAWMLKDSINKSLDLMSKNNDRANLALEALSSAINRLTDELENHK